MWIAGDALRISMYFVGYRDFKSGLGQDWEMEQHYGVLVILA